jgi:hypothetical protein
VRTEARAESRAHRVDGTRNRPRDGRGQAEGASIDAPDAHADDPHGACHALAVDGLCQREGGSHAHAVARERKRAMLTKRRRVNDPKLAGRACAQERVDDQCAADSVEPIDEGRGLGELEQLYALGQLAGAKLVDHGEADAVVSCCPAAEADHARQHVTASRCGA